MSHYVDGKFEGIDSMAATGPSDFHGDCGRVAERHGSRGQETGAGRQGGRGQRTGDRGGEARGAIPSLHNRSRKEIPPRTKIEDMEKANR